MHARSVFLKLESGLDDHFAIRLSGAPHGLVVLWMGVGIVSDAFKQKRIDSLYGDPMDCLTLYARRLRAAHNKDSFRRTAMDDVL